MRKTTIVAACCALLFALPASAQDETEKAVEKYRQMLKEDPWSNPGFLDADRGEGARSDARLPQGVARRRGGRFPDLVRVVLDPSGPGEMLRELLLRDAEPAPARVEDDRARAAGSLVERQDLRHAAQLCGAAFGTSPGRSITALPGDHASSIPGVP